MKKIIWVLPLLLTIGLLQACGQKELATEPPGSFAAAAGTHRYAAPVAANSADQLKPDSKRPDQAEAALAQEAVMESSAAEELEEGNDEPGGQAASPDNVAPAPHISKDGKEQAGMQKPSATEAKAADKADGGVQKSSANKSGGDTIEPDAKKAADDKSEPSENKATGSRVETFNNQALEGKAKKAAEQTASKAELNTETGKPAMPKKENKTQTAEGSTKSGPERIGWSEFFDGDDQTTPSERFWDLSGSTVTIKGFMGEVLSFEKNWFLLIPEPGAECPFDNGDETYWNKIMIVFVPDDVKLRYKSEPLQITGRLDVGIKIDESGYKTMFRLYDASFKEIKS